MKTREKNLRSKTMEEEKGKVVDYKHTKVGGGE